MIVLKLEMAEFKTKQRKENRKAIWWFVIFLPLSFSDQGKKTWNAFDYL